MGTGPAILKTLPTGYCLPTRCAASRSPACPGPRLGLTASVQGTQLPTVTLQLSRQPVCRSLSQAECPALKPGEARSLLPLSSSLRSGQLYGNSQFLLEASPDPAPPAEPLLAVLVPQREPSGLRASCRGLAGLPHDAVHLWGPRGRTGLALGCSIQTWGTCASEEFLKMETTEG